MSEEITIDTVRDVELANAIRMLSVDAVEKANSGHPGMPMGMADVATVLFKKFLKFDANCPGWKNRDRFVLSAGHGSMLLYSLLYLTGYNDINIEDIKNFRQLGAKTAGHPEYGELEGIETTTGPLGQGLANAVGMAISERALSSRFGSDIIDHNIFVIAGDGCLMEGISQEAISLAGHLGLGKLIVLFDDNGISIDGPTSLSTSDNQMARFAASKWHTVECDGHSFENIENSLKEALNDERPSLISCKTRIGYGSPNKEGKSSSHGSPMGKEEIELIRKNLNWDMKEFELPKHIIDAWIKIGSKGKKLRESWEKKYNDYSHKDAIEELSINSNLESLESELLEFKNNLYKNQDSIASRKASENVLNILNTKLTNLIGGSADLTGSNNTLAKNQQPITADNFSGSYIYYGIREHAMAAIMNGIALHGFFIPYAGTFLVFTDYCRPSIRLSALMKLKVIYIMTHDSIGLGEDGPTHQPVEHLSSLRAIPNLEVWRPADTVETLEVWQASLMTKNKPSVLALSRQNLKFVRNNNISENLSSRGAYILEEQEEALVTLIASGSEVGLIVNVAEKLKNENIHTRVVSVPCLDRFHSQNSKYKETVFGLIPKIIVEAGVRQSWDYFMTKDDVFIGMDNFGESAPAKDLYEHFNITEEEIIKSVKNKLNK